MTSLKDRIVFAFVGLSFFTIAQGQTLEFTSRPNLNDYSCLQNIKGLYSKDYLGKTITYYSVSGARYKEYTSSLALSCGGTHFKLVPTQVHEATLGKEVVNWSELGSTFSLEYCDGPDRLVRRTVKVQRGSSGSRLNGRVGRPSVEVIFISLNINELDGQTTLHSSVSWEHYYGVSERAGRIDEILETEQGIVKPRRVEELLQTGELVRLKIVAGDGIKTPFSLAKADTPKGADFLGHLAHPRRQNDTDDLLFGITLVDSEARLEHYDNEYSRLQADPRISKVPCTIGF